MPTVVQQGPAKTQYIASWTNEKGRRQRRYFDSVLDARRHEARMRVRKLGDQLRDAAEAAFHHQRNQKAQVRGLVEGEFKRILASIARRGEG